MRTAISQDFVNKTQKTRQKTAEQKRALCSECMYLNKDENHMVSHYYVL